MSEPLGDLRQKKIARLFAIVASLNSPRQFIKRIVGAYVGMEWIAEMIDVLLHFFGNLAPRKAFKRL